MECHLLRSCVSSSERPHLLMSHFTVSYHLCLGLPLFLFPCILISATILMSSSLSRLRTCPYHWSLLLLMLTAIPSILAISLVCSFETVHPLDVMYMPKHHHIRCAESILLPLCQWPDSISIFKYDICKYLKTNSLG